MCVYKYVCDFTSLENFLCTHQWKRWKYCVVASLIVSLAGKHFLFYTPRTTESDITLWNILFSLFINLLLGRACECLKCKYVSVEDTMAAEIVSDWWWVSGALDTRLLEVSQDLINLNRFARFQGEPP